MTISQISEEQERALEEMCGPINVFSQIVPEKDKDGDRDEEWVKLTNETEQLVILGLLTEITDDHKQRLAEVFIETNRHYRVFEITPVGKAMFGGKLYKC